MVISRFQTPKVANPNKVKALMDMHDDDDDETPPVIEASVTQKAVQPGALTPQQQHEQAKATAKENSKQLQKDSVHAEAEKNRRAGYGGLIGQQEDAATAAKQELAAGKAKAQLDAQSRSNLGGMGLSGASAAINSDVGKQQDRNAVLTMDALRKSQNDEVFGKQQQMAALDDLEEQTGTDYNGDGLIDGKPVAEFNADDDTDEKDAKDTKLREKWFKTHPDLNTYDPNFFTDGKPGSKEEPFLVTRKTANEMEHNGVTFTDAGPAPEGSGYDGSHWFVDQDGHYIIIQD